MGSKKLDLFIYDPKIFTQQVNDYLGNLGLTKANDMTWE
jgi:hypothetical protein